MQDLEMGSPWITWVALDPVTSVLRKGRQRQLDERGGSIKTETAVGVMWPQAKEHWQQPETGRGKEQTLS